jgi:heme exporter protein C
MWQAIKKFYHQLGSPREFYRISAYFIPVFGIGFAVLFVIGAYLGLVVAPSDYQQGDSFRIIYVHVPAAWMSLFIYVVMASAGAIGMIWRIKMAFIIMVCSASIGAMFTFIALVTGSLWGKPIWGTWWQWEARLTSELVLLFLYFGVMALYSSFSERKTAERAAAILCIVGVINIPIIHYSVEWWNSLHQGSTVLREGGPAMPASMLTPLLLMALSFKLYYGWILFIKSRTQALQQEQASNWVKEVIQLKQSREFEND